MSRRETVKAVRAWIGAAACILVAVALIAGLLVNVPK